jgi:hypothetical protein
LTAAIRAVVFGVVVLAAGSGVAAIQKKELLKLGAVQVWQDKNLNVIVFRSGMFVDADGSPRAYHPDDTGLAELKAAGKKGNWWSLATDNGKRAGSPVIQQQGDPAPGYYVSTTSLFDSRISKSQDARRYVDAQQIPYVSLPGPLLRAGKMKLGDLALVINTRTNAMSGAVFADGGSTQKVGEGSIKLAANLGLPADPRKAGATDGVIYVLFPGSSTGWPRTEAEIQSGAQQLFQRWGGMTSVQQMAP